MHSANSPVRVWLATGTSIDILELHGIGIGELILQQRQTTPVRPGAGSTDAIRWPLPAQPTRAMQCRCLISREPLMNTFIRFYRAFAEHPPKYGETALELNIYTLAAICVAAFSNEPQ
ncbi:protein of unknown function [Hyphomicrobium sp. 1Nfss2.1]